METLLYQCDLCGKHARPEWPGQKPKGWQQLVLPAIAATSEDGSAVLEFVAKEDLVCPECFIRVGMAIVQLSVVAPLLSVTVTNDLAPANADSEEHAPLDTSGGEDVAQAEIERVAEYVAAAGELPPEQAATVRAQATEDAPSATEEPTGYGALPNSKLKALCDERGLLYPLVISKAGLVALLEGADKATA